MSYNPTITTVSGYNNPGSSAYTSVQSVYATFPEFNYATTSGNCRTLQYVNGKWQFVQNSNAADNGRIHFIPVWFADGRLYRIRDCIPRMDSCRHNICNKDIEHDQYRRFDLR